MDSTASVRSSPAVEELIEGEEEELEEVDALVDESEMAGAEVADSQDVE